MLSPCENQFATYNHSKAETISHRSIFNLTMHVNISGCVWACLECCEIGGSQPTTSTSYYFTPHSQNTGIPAHPSPKLSPCGSVSGFWHKPCHLMCYSTLQSQACHPSLPHPHLFFAKTGHPCEMHWVYVKINFQHVIVSKLKPFHMHVNRCRSHLLILWTSVKCIKPVAKDDSALQPEIILQSWQSVHITCHVTQILQ